MKTGGKSVSEKPTRTDAYLLPPLSVVIAACSLFLGGCETFAFFLLPEPQDVSNEVQNTPTTEPNAENDLTIASVYQPDSLSAESGTAVEAPADLWIRMQDGFELPHHQNSQRVRDALSWFVDRQTYVERVASRANPYLHYILTRLEQRDLPSELALIPIVESGYQPFARSPGGAAGLWQFIPSTGRRFGLKQNWWYDGRRDVIAATEAALDYLEYLSTKFEGDWLLAIAAYNAGEGTVQAAIKKNRKANLETDYWSLKLPGETKRYIPRLLALARAVEQPGKVGLEFPPLQNRAYFSIIELEGQIDLAHVGEFANITMDEVYLLNPGFNRWATDPEGPHRVLIPIASHEKFITAIKGTSPENLITWQRHEVLPGQTLSEIAAMHHTSVTSLQHVNKLKATLIRTGRSLIVPTSALPLAEYTLSAAGRGVIEIPASGEKFTYVVKKGDNLWSIARRHDTRVKKLTAWNGISAQSILKPGQKLVVWRETSPPRTDPLVAVSGAPLNNNPYIVQPGDSLWTISRRFGVSVAALRRWNRLSKKEYLHPGQQLKVKVTDDAIEI